MTITKRIEMLNDVIIDRVKQSAYRAFYVLYGTKATERGTALKQLNKL